MFKLVQTCPNWFKLVQKISNSFIFSQAFQKRLKLVQIYLNLSKLAQICQRWITHFEIGFKLVEVFVNLQPFFKFTSFCLFHIITEYQQQGKSLLMQSQAVKESEVDCLSQRVKKSMMQWQLKHSISLEIQTPFIS